MRQPFKPWTPDETPVEYTARLEATIWRMHAERLKLDRRIRQQRYALRENWMIVEKRTAHRRAWLRSPLLISLLKTRKPARIVPWPFIAFWSLAFLGIFWAVMACHT